jgi:flagellar biosynthesis protein FlhG
MVTNPVRLRKHPIIAESEEFPVKQARSIQVIAVASGKGGVGKTQLALNLGRALAAMHRRVVLLDAGLAFGDLSTAANLEPLRTIEDVVAGRARLVDVLHESSGGFGIVPTATGSPAMATLGVHQQAALIHAFTELSGEIDALIVDTASGLNETNLGFMSACQEVIIVITPEPASIRNARALIAILNETRGVFRFRVMANMVRNAEEGKQAFRRLNGACEDSLDVALHFLGHIPLDEQLRQASLQQTILLDAAPRSRAALAIRSVAEKVAQLPLPAAPSGNLEFFVETLVRAEI